MSGAEDDKLRLLRASSSTVSASSSAHASPPPYPFPNDQGDDRSYDSKEGKTSRTTRRNARGRSHRGYHTRHHGVLSSRLRIYLHRFVSRRLVLSLLLAVQLWWLYLWNSRFGGGGGGGGGGVILPPGHIDRQQQQRLSTLELKTFEAGLASCAALVTKAPRLEAKDRTVNPRWEANNNSNQNVKDKSSSTSSSSSSSSIGQKTIILRNATLFDGESFLPSAVDIALTNGLVVSVSPSTSESDSSSSSKMDSSSTTGIISLHGAYVTPGLVDMHSHHLAVVWPLTPPTQDENEMHDDFGPLTPFVRILDLLKAYDEATARIASGGVTTSLIIPGSANIMGGEGTVVKNAVKPGKNGEYVVEEMLFEHGVVEGQEEKHRYMKMACGENPKSVYGHTRMGNVWVLRKWLARAKELLEKQDEWCEAAYMAMEEKKSTSGNEAVVSLLADKGVFPEELELDSTVGLLRGSVALHNHCYEPEDMETMLRVSHEFGFHVKAFHHALAAWQVPEMLKEYGENVTVATFAEFSLYKQEAYAASLYAGKILNDHGVPVAYKSDHVGEDTSAQYLMLQPVVAHSFGLPEDKALQAVTSVPAKALDIHNRVGYVRPGYDADLVVWDAHPLSVGATPKQVYIDGLAQLDPAKVAENTAHVIVSASETDGDHRGATKPEIRASITKEERQRTCTDARKQGQTFVITGITKSFVGEYPDTLSLNKEPAVDEEDLVLVVQNGTMTCLGSSIAGDCSIISAQLLNKIEGMHMDLKNGHVTRGLTAVTASLGISEISMVPESGDGSVDLVKPKEAQDEDNIGYAKYAISLGGSKVSAKTFARARLGGVTRAIQSPVTKDGFIVGVSTGMRTGLNSTLLNGGLFQDDVAMHVVLGDEAKGNDGSVSMAIEKLRALIKAGSKAAGGDATHPWTLVANGSLPLVVKASANHDIQQSILLKKDYPKVNVVLLGGHEAPLFANELAAAKVPLILTANHPGPDSWRKREAPPGPPLSRSPADILHEAGVVFGIACPIEGPPGDSRIHSTALEAAWAAKYAGLDEAAALDLVSTNIEQILGLEKSDDIVVWEGNPLQLGTPVLAFQSQDGWLEVSSCWPNEEDE
ncbi:hypothetical protein BD289DRAFT_443226 [Coniella lustricola]|uniref:Amidohydrolase-related domain-containing protein n=1 Tax=Coniella lustricola TaxID=2025994 RepID=A0A2T2ZXC1_9PEZI|nr:hypothetical protein BD289DRAFT_443226 [Coniella lustricola]